MILYNTQQFGLVALIFVKYNIKLKLRQEKRGGNGKTYDEVHLSVMDLKFWIDYGERIPFIGRYCLDRYS